MYEFEKSNLVMPAIEQVSKTGTLIKRIHMHANLERAEKVAVLKGLQIARS